MYIYITYRNKILLYRHISIVSDQYRIFNRCFIAKMFYNTATSADFQSWHSLIQWHCFLSHQPLLFISSFMSLLLLFSPTSTSSFPISHYCFSSLHYYIAPNKNLFMKKHLHLTSHTLHPQLHSPFPLSLTPSPHQETF